MDRENVSRFYPSELLYFPCRTPAFPKPYQHQQYPQTPVEQMEHIQKKVTHLCFAETSHANETLIIIYWHDARNNRTMDSNLATVIHELEVNISVIKQLSNDEICSSIHLHKIIGDMKTCPQKSQTHTTTRSIQIGAMPPYLTLQIGKLILVSLQCSQAILSDDIGMAL